LNPVLVATDTVTPAVTPEQGEPEIAVPPASGATMKQQRFPQHGSR
jgi:hypothetical protein